MSGLWLVSGWHHLFSLELRGPGPSPAGVVCLASLSFIIRRSFVSSNNITLVVPLFTFFCDDKHIILFLFLRLLPKSFASNGFASGQKHFCNICLFPQSYWFCFSNRASDWPTLGLVTKHGLWWHIHRPGINLADLWKIFL